MSDGLTQAHGQDARATADARSTVNPEIRPANLRCENSLGSDSTSSLYLRSMSKIVLVTGSSGLIGSEVCTYFARELGYQVHGLDNNQRAVFFGPQGDTRWNQRRLQETLPGFVHHELDIRDRAGVLALVRQLKPAAIRPRGRVGPSGGPGQGEPGPRPRGRPHSPATTGPRPSRLMISTRMPAAH